MHEISIPMDSSRLRDFSGGQESPQMSAQSVQPVHQSPAVSLNPEVPLRDTGCPCREDMFFPPELRF